MPSLHDLLEDGIRFDPHYLPSMNSDHMPMTLCAMSALGADEGELIRYRDDYAQILRPVAAAESLQTWQEGAGNMTHYAALLRFFRAEVENRGIEPVVREILPQFVHCLASQAFHPLIRLGYAIEFNSRAETAAALAYLVASARVVPIDTDQPIDLGELLTDQAQHPIPITGVGFGGGLNHLLEAGIYPLGIAASFSECAARALDIYRSTRNFFALHMVTATRAARICSRFVDDKLILASLTGALLAAHRIVGSPAFDADHPMKAPGHLDREHIYKYIHVCVSEYKTYGDERYLDEVTGFRQNGLIADWVARDIMPPGLNIPG